MDEILDKQQKFFATGETQAAAYRIRMLKRLREAILAFEQDILDALHRDLKKPKLDAYAMEIGHCLTETTFVLKHLKKWMKPRRVGGSKLLPLSSGWIVPEPLGISLILSPLELSLRALRSRPLSPLWRPGNCVILKPSEISRNTERVIAKMIAEHFDDSSVSRRLRGSRHGAESSWPQI